MLKLKDIHKSFNGLNVLKGVNLELHPGEILGLIGPNGAGKTTLFNVISGLLKPDQGEVFYRDKEITKWTVEARVRKLHFGRTFQLVKPFLNLTCEENVLVGLELHSWSAEQKRDRAHELLNMMGLGQKSFLASRHLTLIEKKKLELARALTIEPKLLLLDEIMSGLNPAEVNQATELIQKLNQDYHITIFWIEHLVRAVTQIATRVAVLHQGVMIASGSSAKVLQDPQVIEAYLGDSNE